MKGRKKILLLALFAVATLVFSACSKTQTNNDFSVGGIVITDAELFEISILVNGIKTDYSLDSSGCFNISHLKSGDVITFSRDVRILVMEGKHAKPGKSQVFQKLFSRRFLQYFRNALALAYLNPKFPEGGQTLMYEVHAEGKRVQVMGSLGLQEDQEYPQGADLLILPFQGSEFLEAVALEVVERLQPKRILLDHFDDAFPPVSEHVDTRRFKKLMDEEYPQIKVVKPTAGKTVVL